MAGKKPVPRKKDAPPNRLKRDAIVQASVRVFAEQGYYNSRISDVVRTAGVAQGLFYYYFRSKEEILITIYQEAWWNLIARMDRLRRDMDDPLDQIRSALLYILKSFRVNPDLMKVLIMDVPRVDGFYNQENQGLYHRFFDDLAGFVREGQERGLVRPELSPLVAAYMIHASLDSLIRHHIYNPGFEAEAAPIDAAVEQVFSVLANGLLQTRPD
ncbi:MAG: TetR/AcrR family transcriptional regulator [Proteobacteria bacterium]|nr:TetR/AcrR family transcriptional regulator [Pseudomonadota bacterium]